MMTKCFKLTSGQTIISRVIQNATDDAILLLYCPMLIEKSLSTTGSIVEVMMPFSMYNSNESVHLYKQHVVAEYDVNESYVRHYEELVIHYVNNVKPQYKQIMEDQLEQYEAGYDDSYAGIATHPGSNTIN